MKRWGIAVLVAILSCIPVLFHKSSSPGLLADSDTAFLLKAIRERNSPISWFTGDWPLGNHFYRPMSTLAFELDNRLYGDNAAGYGLTNALICCLCISLLAWFAREVTDNIGLTAIPTCLFASWHWGGLTWIASTMVFIAPVVAFFGLFRHGFKLWLWLPAVGSLYLLAYEWSGMVSLYYRVVAWLPGRTASVMTIFCLLALAAYARYERLGATRQEAEPTSEDEPATKNTVAPTETRKSSLIWPVVSLIAVGAALASYEQAVMLPATLLGVGISFWLRKYRVRWSWNLAFWALIVVYFLVRRSTIPSGVSSYQAQQFRHGGGIWLSLASYMAPQTSTVFAWTKSLEIGPEIFLTSQCWMSIWAGISNVLSFLAWRGIWVLALTGFALSFLAYLPMAWLNQFDHYHYWPLAMRSIYVAALAYGTWMLCISAVSHPKKRAPKRLSPAPGSLLHR